jgi:hypothetical protein
MAGNPKVFLSYASEDRQRFVSGFAANLRERGIDLWLDQWELFPGDLLTEKIFAEGIGRSQALIVVLSRNSVKKAWVQREIDAAITRRSEHSCKLIPVVIEECEVPQSLIDLVWVRISDLTSYESELNRIVLSVFGRQAAPPMGSPPAAALTSVQGLVLKLAGEQVMTTGGNSVLALMKETPKLGIDLNLLQEALHRLANRKLIGLSLVGRGNLGNILNLYMTREGFEQYARENLSDYPRLVRSVILQILNLDNTHNDSLAESLGKPQVLIDHILRLFKDQHILELLQFGDGRICVSKIYAEFQDLVGE